MALAVVRDLSTARHPASPEELEAFETDVFAGFVLARASAGLADGTIRGDMSHLEQVRSWFGRPLWEMQPADADAYFGRTVRSASQGTRLAYAQSLSTFFGFLELRFRAELHAMTGTVIACPLDEMNRPRGRGEIGLRIPPTDPEVETLFTGWRDDLSTCRKFAPAARNYTAAKLISLVGLRINEARRLDLDDVRWELGHFGKLHVRFGKGTQGSGPRQRVVPLINGADRLLRWYIEDVWGYFDADHTRPGAPLFATERHHADGSATRVGADSLRRGLAEAVGSHLPTWSDRLTPHVLRHLCASQLYRHGMDLLAIQELLGHWWVATTMRYVHVLHTHVEDAWIAGQERAAARLKGLAR
ncbi:tyrosine-type recombinase/integrase [Streptomyces europaeiscabiei]|uniref:tyrosine-type recombinase/integrase n=1 Tax=Streptomyces europaeiscabiei TaxID=146819 RepID=UPI0029B33E15|nr:tyrosine-type recombinase/integrase [Streptomyces europaeiscabiei]MDX3617055.1 tyrosine-type recombinase/integrase [Streptomyces europaeiscabiei]